MSTTKEKASTDFNPRLETARADILDWARKPTTEKEYFSFARLNSRAPFAASTFLIIMDRIEQLKNAKYHQIEEIEKIQDEKEKEQAYENLELDPRKFELDISIENTIAHEFIKKVFSGTVGVQGKRATELLTTVKDMARPTGGGLGFLAPLFANKDQELDTPEEIPMMPEDMT